MLRKVMLVGLAVSSAGSGQNVGDHYEPYQGNGLSTRDCPDCPSLTRVDGAETFGFSFATTFEITWVDYGHAVRERGCDSPLAVPEKLDPSGDRKARTNVDDPRFKRPIAVSGISLRDAECFIAWLNARSGHIYSLPTAQQWRWLAYRGATTIFPWGDQAGRNKALLAPYFDRERFQPESYATAVLMPRVVGQTAPDRHGLYDTIGNASELTSDCRYYSTKKPHPDDQLLSCAVVGGSTIGRFDERTEPGTPYRVIMSDHYPDAFVGLRLVR